MPETTVDLQRCLRMALWIAVIMFHLIPSAPGAEVGEVDKRAR